LFTIVILLAAAFVTIDGDTINLAGEKVRIANIDAPEIGHAGCADELDLAIAAKQRLHELLKSGRIALRRGDPVDGRVKDRYGRTLGLITVDGVDVGETLIREGYARRWTGRREPWCD